MAPALRRAARVVLLDPQDRVLLIRFHDRDRGATWWATPGGSLHPGESHEDAARREVREETGLRDLELGPCIWTREHLVTIAGRLSRQQERIHLAKVPAFEPDDRWLEPDERTVIMGFRWWTLAELHGTDDELSPRDLPYLLERLLSHGPPDSPITVGV